MTIVTCGEKVLANGRLGKGADVRKAVGFVEICGMTLLTLGGAALLIAPAAEARDALARRLSR